MGYVVSRDDGWRMPGWLWERGLLPLLKAPVRRRTRAHPQSRSTRSTARRCTPISRSSRHWIPGAAQYPAAMTQPYRARRHTGGDKQGDKTRPS